MLHKLIQNLLEHFKRYGVVVFFQNNFGHVSLHAQTLLFGVRRHPEDTYPWRSRVPRLWRNIE